MAIITDAFLITADNYGSGRYIYITLNRTRFHEPSCGSGDYSLSSPLQCPCPAVDRFIFLRLVHSKKAYLWVIHNTTAALIVSDVCISIHYFLQCRSIRNLWQPKTSKGCFNRDVNTVATFLYQGKFAC